MSLPPKKMISPIKSVGETQTYNFCRDFKPTKLNFSTLKPCFLLDGNPCQDISVGDCAYEEDAVVGAHPYPLDLCHQFCSKDDKCLFWRHNQAEQNTSQECTFFGTDYHQVRVQTRISMIDSIL